MMTRAQHLKWAKDRALEYADRGELANAMSLITSDLNKHPETAGHSGIELMGTLAFAGHMDSAREVRDFIEGLN